jgi:glycosyltransferase involved in cell wall biosynthesis
LFLATRDWYNPATTGGDNTMWEEARYLASRGHDVTFVAAGYAGAQDHESVEGINVVRLGRIHWLWLSTLLYYLREGRGKYDVVVAEGFGGSRVPRLAPLYVREPIITEWHQIHRDLFAIQYPRLLNGPLNLLEHLAAWVSRNTLVRAGTEEWRRAFPQIGFKAENVFLLPVSIRDEWLQENGARPMPGNTILWLGKLRRYKCPDHAIRAMVEVVKAVPDSKLTLSIRRDDLTYEQELQSLARSLGVAEHVEFRFNVTEQEKRDLLRAARVLVVPSAVEGFGIVTLEANACGVPVIASSGVPEGAVEDGVNGLRYRFGDIAGLGDQLVRLLRDQDLYSQLSENSLKRVARFKWSQVGAEFERVVASAAVRR